TVVRVQSARAAAATRSVRWWSIAESPFRSGRAVLEAVGAAEWAASLRYRCGLGLNQPIASGAVPQASVEDPAKPTMGWTCFRIQFFQGFPPSFVGGMREDEGIEAQGRLVFTAVARRDGSMEQLQCT